MQQHGQILEGAKGREHGSADQERGEVSGAPVAGELDVAARPRRAQVGDQGADIGGAGALLGFPREPVSVYECG